MSPYQHTPQDVVAALLQDSSRPELVARPQPVGKDLRATLAGKGNAMSLLAQRVAQRDGPHLQQRVALTDGAEALQQQLVMPFRSTPWCSILSTPPSICGTRPTRCWGRPIPSAWPG